MDSLSSDIEALERAMRAFFQTMKRPQRWAHTAAQAGVALDRPGAITLYAVIEGGGQSRVQDIADMLGIEAPSVTRRTQELEQLGYLRRVPNAKDKRVVNLEATALGHEVSQRLHEVQRQATSRAIAHWTADERHQFAQLLERFSHDLRVIDTVHK